MAQTFLPCTLDQPLLLQQDMREWLPEDHLALFVAETVAELDLSKILKWYQRRDGRGRLAYHPEMLVRLLIYSYCVGVLSSRRIEAAVVTDVAFRILASNQQPDHTTLAEFRRRHKEEFEELFVQVLKLCKKVNLVRVGTIALDGTKMKANASKHQSYTYKDLEKKQQELEEIVRQLEERATQIDAKEDEENKPPSDRMPEGMKTASDRLAVIQRARKQLEEEARRRKENAQQDVEKAKAEGRAPSEAEKKRLQRAKQVEGDIDKGPQINLVDADSR